MLLRFFSRKWILATILVVISVGVMIRLGIWQLDRLEQRRAFNARVNAQISQPVLDLNIEKMPANLDQMEYRQVKVLGTYDFSGEISLRNQYWDNQWGVHLVTPLKIQGSDLLVLVDRGWIPGETFQAGETSEFNEPGIVAVTGVIRSSQDRAELGRRSDPTPVPGGASLDAWNFVNLPELSKQIEGSLLPIYIQQAPEPSWKDLPYRSQPELDLTEGPHMGYAIQWFIFAAILGFGYPFYVHRQQQKNLAVKSKSENPSNTAPDINSPNG